MNPFRSNLKSELYSFLIYKRGLGFGYVRAEGTLRNFDRHLQSLPRGLRRKLDLQTVIKRWVEKGRDNRKAISTAMDLSVVRQFCLYRRRWDPRGFVPGREWFPQSMEPRFQAHILSQSEVRLILNQIAQEPHAPIHRLGRRLLWLILYCTGMRFGEVGRLRVEDLDLRRRVLLVRESKGRTRLVPFGSDLAQVFRGYLESRGESLTSSAPLLLNHHERQFTTRRISNTVLGWLRKTGLKPSRGRIGPRPYDIRHTFAVHRLLRWYRQGVELSGRLPWLSAYMGHANILGTEIYLTTTPELMTLVSRRFEARFRSKTTKT